MTIQCYLDKAQVTYELVKYKKYKVITFLKQ